MGQNEKKERKEEFHSVRNKQTQLEVKREKKIGGVELPVSTGRSLKKMSQPSIWFHFKTKSIEFPAQITILFALECNYFKIYYRVETELNILGLEPFKAFYT